MLDKEIDFLYDATEETSTRFVCFVSESMKRFDLAITSSNRFYGKKLVTDIQYGITAILGPDDVEEEGCLERLFRLSEEEAADLRSFLGQIIGTVNFTDI
ncbi:DUF3055 domain-containing protein [Paenibacillus sp. J2TS4]|uniref:DUF3055 domain-containing protein n=1 Tax=Paenibacillus sp. J2TS4 TaxID=2807194 RepID=UPI001B0DF806|nr:DUF3055 domain-containing protein [Paenibacillus sp. J2TS4]GIP34338.1 hypothetical protein J2TS4_35480 [Paenibacillus sp. J2TS4]